MNHVASAVISPRLPSARSSGRRSPCCTRRVRVKKRGNCSPRKAAISRAGHPMLWRMPRISSKARKRNWPRPSKPARTRCAKSGPNTRRPGSHPEIYERRWRRLQGVPHAVSSPHWRRRASRKKWGRSESGPATFSFSSQHAAIWLARYRSPKFLGFSTATWGEHPMAITRSHDFIYE